MTPDRFDQVQALLTEALDLPREERKAFLARRCGEDLELRREVAELLAYREADPGFLNSGIELGDLSSLFSSELKAGDQLEDFEILRELDRGGMGIVYEARQRSLGRIVALKILPNYLATLTPSAVKRFHNEARILGQLDHPSVVKVHARGEAGSTYFFAMEFLRGAPLHAVLERLRLRKVSELETSGLEAAVAAVARERSPAPRSTASSLPREAAPRRTYVEAVCRLVIEVADALHHAHLAGVIHRDVKPSNIIVREDGSAVLTDFGLARGGDGITQVTEPGQLAGGSPQYMSPEQVREGAPLDHRTDVYSLGVTLYELLTLRMPFDGASKHEVYAKITSYPPPPPQKFNATLPRDIATIVLTAVDKDPARRYQSAEALAADLRAFLEYRPIAARPLGVLLRSCRFARRQPALAALLAVLAMALPTLTALALYAHRKANEDRARERIVRLERALDNGFMSLFYGSPELRGAFDEVLAASPENPLARTGKAMTFLLERDLEGALTYVRSVPEEFTSRALCRIEAEALRRSGAEAEAKATEAGLGLPDDGLEYLVLGLVDRQRLAQEWSDALSDRCFRYLDQAIWRGSNGVAVVALEAMNGVWRQDDPDEATERRRNIASALQDRAPLSPHAWFFIGFALASGDAAIAAYQRCIELHAPTRVLGMAYNNLGVALRNAHRMDEALDAYRKGMECGSAQAAATYAEMLYYRNDSEASFQALRRSVALEPTVKNCTNLGIEFLNRGETVESRSAFEKALELASRPWVPSGCLGDQAPGNQINPGQRYNLLVWASAAFEGSKAAELLRQAMALDPDRPWAYLDLAALEARRGDHAAATEVALEGLNQALPLADAENCCIAYARSQEALGFSAEAAEMCRTVLANGPDRATRVACLRVYIKALASLGTFDLARQHLSALLDEAPGDLSIWQYAASLCAGPEALPGLADPLRALAYAERAAELEANEQTDTATTHALLACALQALGTTADAERVMAKALGLLNTESDVDSRRQVEAAAAWLMGE